MPDRAAIASSLSSDSPGENEIASSALIGTATTAARAATTAPSRVCTSTWPLRCATSATAAPRRRSTGAPVAIACSSARVPPAIVTRPPVNCVSSRL